MFQIIKGKIFSIKFPKSGNSFAFNVLKNGDVILRKENVTKEGFLQGSRRLNVEMGRKGNIQNMSEL